MSKLVSIFCCGAQKGGTTSLHAHFAEHPSLSPPHRKETHFFDSEDIDWVTPDYSRLDAFYLADDGDRRRFDITPIYGFWPPSIGRIRQYNPNSKLIFLFRDPFDRAWSQWCMETARGAEDLHFADAIRDGRRRLADLPPLAAANRVYTYVERGLYTEQVQRALAHFPRKNLLFLRSEDLLNDHLDTLERIAAHLDIPSFPDTGPKREHLRPAMLFTSVASEADRRFIAGLVQEDLRAFAKLTDLDIADWPTMRQG